MPKNDINVNQNEVEEPDFVNPEDAVREFEADNGIKRSGTFVAKSGSKGLLDDAGEEAEEQDILLEGLDDEEPDFEDPAKMVEKYGRKRSNSVVGTTKLKLDSIDDVDLEKAKLQKERDELEADKAKFMQQKRAEEEKLRKEREQLEADKKKFNG
ncbi:MAG: hypothetical protein K6F77_07200, partial [Lachnospiraceae bacterium]|nr:hypothetical protein [Lachnospiraceae bacterium]